MTLVGDKAWLPTLSWYMVVVMCHLNPQVSFVIAFAADMHCHLLKAGYNTLFSIFDRNVSSLEMVQLCKVYLSEIIALVNLCQPLNNHS